MGVCAWVGVVVGVWCVTVGEVYYVVQCTRHTPMIKIKLLYIVPKVIKCVFL